jgi:flagellar biosynthesis/type III secretory pathway chaperone
MTRLPPSSVRRRPEPPSAALVAVLREEAAEIGRLLPLLAEQEQALVGGDAATLLALLERQEPVLRRLTALEGERRAVARRLARQLGVEPDALTIARLLGEGAAPEGLQAVGAELRGLLDALLARHRRNAFLVERSLGWLGRLVEHLLGALGVGTSATYAAGGRSAAPLGSLRLLDRRA